MRIAVTCLFACAVLTSAEHGEMPRVPLAKPQWDIEAAAEAVKKGFEQNPATRELYDFAVERDSDENYVLRWRSAPGDAETEVLWIPRIHLQAIVDSRVGRAKEGDLYEFFYSVHNGSDSRQNFYTLCIEAKSPIAHSESPDRPVGREWRSRKMPEPWKGTYWRWSDPQGLGPYGIPAGMTESGFVLKSAGLPSVTTCFASGFSEGFKLLKDGGNDNELPMCIDNILPRGLKRDCVSGPTIGPGETPTATTPAAGVLLQDLLDGLPVCLEQRWIATREIADRLKAHLEDAKTGDAAGDPVKVESALKGAIGEVNRCLEDANPSVTSEVEALFVLNSQFLLERIAAKRNGATKPAP